MSAAEVIELIKRLPPAERAEVAAYLQDGAKNGDRAEAAVAEPGVKYLPMAEAQQRAEKIFQENRELFRRLAQ